MTCAIGAASALGARGRTSCKRQVSGSIPLTGSQVSRELEAASPRYEEWSAKTIGARETAGKAKAELQRRGHEAAPTQTPQPPSTLQWWQELEANIEAVDRALAHQQQAAIDVGQAWPPVRHPAA